MAGRVRINGSTQNRAGYKVPEGAAIEVHADERYVSRGGYKLEHALKEFVWSPAGLRCLDVGASTGGFTDCLLQHGAAAVVAVDVGYGHFAWSLRQDSRVTVVERCNFRNADVGRLGAPFEFASIDVSFISLGKLALQLHAALEPGGNLIALVKPQFEAGRAAVEKGGVVRDAATHERAIEDVALQLTNAGFVVEQLAYSPLKGPAGNIEFLLGARARSDIASPDIAPSQRIDIAGVVRKAHEALG